MKDSVDLERYPLDRPESAAFQTLVRRCQEELEAEGMFNLPGFVRDTVIARCAEAMQPRLDSESFTHQRWHNVYFLKQVDGLPADHPALSQVRTVNHTLCHDQISETVIARIYEWPPMAAFLAAVMEKPSLHVMDDPLSGVNVISYREGETLNWHFDRSQFTTTLLIQSPEMGGEFQYRSDLRTESDPNYEGVARLLRGEDGAIRTLPVTPGTLNVFRGRNTLHRVSPPSGRKDRIIAIFSYYDRPGVSFSSEERMGFYGRTQ
jgi:alkylated DNA repair dioxygenase AlkB